MTNRDYLKRSGLSAREIWELCHVDGQPQVKLKTVYRWLSLSDQQYAPWFAVRIVELELLLREALDEPRGHNRRPVIE